MTQIRRSLFKTLQSPIAPSAIGTRLDEEITGYESNEKGEVRVSKRILWAIRDKKFHIFLDILETHVSGLRRLLPVPERKAVEHEDTRFGLQIIQGLSDMESLSKLQRTPE
jgi:hypothetical protein